MQVEVVPAIALGQPEDFIAAAEIATVGVAVNEYEGVALFIDDRCMRALFAIHSDHPVFAKPALDEFIGQAASVITPPEIPTIEGIFDEFFIRRQHLAAIGEADPRGAGVDFLTGLRVGPDVVLWLELVGWGAFDEMKLMFGNIMSPPDREAGGIGSPQGRIAENIPRSGRNERCPVSL